MLFNHAYWNVNRIGISVDECTLKGINVDHALCGSIGSSHLEVRLLSGGRRPRRRDLVFLFSMGQENVYMHT